MRNEPNLEVAEPRKKRSTRAATAVSEEVKSSSAVPEVAHPEVHKATALKVQKSLKLAKSEDGKKKEVKVTTTIVKAKASKTPAKKTPAKKRVAKKVAPKRKMIKV